MGYYIGRIQFCRDWEGARTEGVLKDSVVVPWKGSMYGRALMDKEGVLGLQVRISSGFIQIVISSLNVSSVDG